MSEENTFRLQGLSCTNCAAKFERNIELIESVEEVSLNFGAAKLSVTGDVTVDQLEAAGAFDGIQVYPEADQSSRPHVPFWKKRANFPTILAFLFTLVGYTFFFTVGDKHFLTIGSFIVAIILGGTSLFKEGVRNLVHLTFDMKTLMTIAIIGAVLLGDFAEGAVVVFLFALSEALETYSMDKARQSISSLVQLTPKQAWIKRDNDYEQIPVESIAIGDSMLVKPGERIAMDGQVISGDSSINQASITGESIPVYKQQGEEVFAGTLNGEGSLEIKVNKLVGDTTIAKIIHLVEEAQAERAPSQKFVDRFAKYYTPAIMLIALFVAILPPLLFGADWSAWIYQGLAVLVVGCPCALIISTPVAIVTAIGNAARNGVLIKGGIHLEEAAKLDVMAFDKTGTLTKGTPAVTTIIPLGGYTEETVLTHAAAIETFSQHPLATAIIDACEQQTSETVTAADFQSITGKGANATINNISYQIGSPSLFEHHPAWTADVSAEVTQLQHTGKTVVILANDHELLGVLGISDQIRGTSKSVVEQLHQLGIDHTVLLTGDNQATGQAIGAAVEIDDVQTDLLPADKLTAVQAFREKDKKAGMIGDGVNDAPALAAAPVGIAMGGAGTDTAIETADIALMGDDLTKLPYTISLSRKTLSIIKQNIGLAFALKLGAILLTIPGLLTLWIAIVADMGATLIVMLNALRLIRTSNRNNQKQSINRVQTEKMAS